MLLLDWTFLFALGWITHLLCRGRHSRWRLILWRGILLSSLLAPLMAFVPLPVYQIPVRPAFAQWMKMHSAMPGEHPAKPSQANAVAKQSEMPAFALMPHSLSWKHALWIIWGLGAVGGGFRLIRHQAQLNHLRQESRLASRPLQEHMRKIQTLMRVQRAIDLRVSDSVASAFACGPLKPTVLVSESLMESMPTDERTALLAHEIAHIGGHDLFWCVGWRWVQAVF